MTLTNRLSLFSLTALGLVLAGFSLTLYFLARTYLFRQVDDRLESVLNTLTALAEIKPDGVEWESAERNLSLGRDSDDQQVYWLVQDDQGRRIDGNVPPSLLAGSASTSFGARSASKGLTGEFDAQEQPWRLSQRVVRANSLPTPSATQITPPPEEEGPRYPMLVITAAVSLQPVNATLRNLALALSGTSLGVWLIALFAGRSLCRRALRPVTQMAAAARIMDTADLSQRLPGGTGDELDDLTRAFNGLLDRLQESFERQRRFTGDASHQMRTPLAALLGQIEVALRRNRSPEEYRRALSAVQTQAGHLRQIMEMLLFLARADAEAKLPGLETVDLEAWLGEHLRAWSAHPRAADLRLEAEPTTDMASDRRFAVEVQPPLLGQLVDNLLDNSVKYSEPGTPISLRLRVERSDVCLEVKDQGCGIAPEDLPHVFDAFYRSSQARRLGVDGVGLGLAVAQRIAVAFGGQITVQSEAGKGSSFTLRLPAK